MAEATAGLPIEIVQSTSDEGRGLLHHVETDLGAHHSPDLFHVQQELIRGTSGALASKTRQAEEAVAETIERLSAQREAQVACDEGIDLECASELAEQLAQAEAQEQAARRTLETAQSWQEQAKAASQGINAAYHPYDLETGAAGSAEEVSASLRFFGAKPKSLFEWLLDHVELPGRPAQKRLQTQHKEYLVPAAA